MGCVISGHLRAETTDGTILDMLPGDVFEVPPGHDAWVVGDEQWISVDWSGRRFFGKAPDASAQRILATVLLTDIVGSTTLAAELGDDAWRDRLAEYNAMLRRALERHHGREVNTTGDGLLARFESPAHAVRCALETTVATRTLGLEQRVGIHT